MLFICEYGHDRTSTSDYQELWEVVFFFIIPQIAQLVNDYESAYLHFYKKRSENVAMCIFIYFNEDTQREVQKGEVRTMTGGRISSFKQKDAEVIRSTLYFLLKLTQIRLYELSCENRVKP